MKTAISLPDQVFEAAERLSRKKGMSRSELYATAIQFYVDRESKTGITDQLNKVYSGAHDIDTVPELAGIADLPKDDWK